MAKHHLEALAAAAEALPQAGEELGAVRQKFANVSQHLVGVIAAEPSLAEGRYVFECPMVEGYQKWVQAKNEIANPYMGSAMLDCGMVSKWE
jgi:hypothetical protein